MKKLKIAKELFFPLDVVTQTLAAIGRKGAGKTYLATMLAEQMLDANAQVIALDPVGNWWGLRVGADGRSKGKEIFVIGGEHGDVPIVPEAGARIARLLIEKSVSAVLDVSGFRLGERKRFCTEFGEELFHLKKRKQTPVHIFIEEAQLVIPQRVGPDEARMVGAFEQIIRLGRNYGIGCTLVTQRPQSVNKEVLSQVECLCVLQVTGPHERKALEEWVQEVGADRKLVGELPSLAQGEGYVWSPSWLRIYERVHFAKKETFDASATPIVGKETKAASLSAVDVEKLRIDMADVVAQAEKDDPKALRKRIVELEREIVKTKKPVEAIVEVKKVEVPTVLPKDYVRILDAVKSFEKAAPRFEILTKVFNEAVSQFNSIGRTLEQFNNRQPIKLSLSKTPPIYSKPVSTYFKSTTFENATTPLRAGAMKMLNWLAGTGTLSKQRLATLSGFAVTGGTFNTYISELKRNGWIVGNGDLTITEEGMKNSDPQPMPSGEELLTMWKSKFREGAGRILQFVYEHYPSGTTKTEIGDAVGFEATGGTFNTYISELRRNGLVVVEDDLITISEEFFK